MTDIATNDRRAEPRLTPERRTHPREPFVEFQDVHKAYGSKQVLRGANLKVFRGEVVVILGGCGSQSKATSIFRRKAGSAATGPLQKPL